MFTNDELFVLNYCFENFNYKYTASEIAKKLNLNQKTVSNYLNLYFRKNFFNSVFQGRNKLFFFNLNNFDIIKRLYLQVEVEKSIFFFEKNFKIREIVKKLNFEKYLIFGSYAKGLEKKNSDLDIFLVGKYDEKKVKKLEKFYGIEINIKSILKKKFKKLLIEKQILLNEIVLNHIIVDDYDFFVDNFFKYYYRIGNE